MKTHLFAIFFLLAATVASARTNPFDMPERFEAHNQLRMQLIETIQKKDNKEMESVARKGVALLPEDPLWYYNLACALALQGKDAQAGVNLDKAISLGFSNVEMLETDEDLTSMRRRADFKRYLDKARRVKPEVTPYEMKDDLLGVVEESDTAWDYDMGIFRTYFQFPQQQPATTNLYNGAGAKQVQEWLKAKTAAGSYGILYDNRDEGHSQADVKRFPGLAQVRYGEEAKQRGLQMAGARFLYNATVIGNSSLAMTEGPFWRCISRSLTTGTRQGALLFMQYSSNHLYVYPSHQDYLADKVGDAFSANSPYLVTSLGSSFSDKPFVHAFISTMAAMDPEVAKFLTQSGRIAPTLQMLLRSTQKHLASPDEYLTGKAHRVVLNPANVNAEAMVKLAHAMTTNTIPPLAYIRLEQMNPPPARQGVDFFDARSDELVVQTPALFSMVMRGPAEKRSLRFAAGAIPPGVTEKMEYKWVVLQGDPQWVEIKPETPDNSSVTITLTHPPMVPFVLEPSSDPEKPALMTSRVDVGVFVSNGTSWSPPAMVSFYYLPNEERIYDKDGRLVKIDYAKAAAVYADPILTLPKRWIDVYKYDAKGVMTGWDRTRGNLTEAFTADGFKVETRDKLGRPQTARVVDYLPRTGAGPAGGVELSQSDSPRIVTYTYSGPTDQRGTFKVSE